MTTFRKLPIDAPNMKNQAATKNSNERNLICWMIGVGSTWGNDDVSRHTGLAWDKTNGRPKT